MTPSAILIHGSGADISTDRSSTNNVGVTIGKAFHGPSTMRIITRRISAVADPDPAVIPLIALISREIVEPILNTLVSRYVAMANLKNHKG